MTCWNVTSVAAILSGSHHSTLSPESIGVNGERATIDLSIAVKNIHMPRMKNTIPSPFFVVSLFVARLR